MGRKKSLIAGKREELNDSFSPLFLLFCANADGAKLFYARRRRKRKFPTLKGDVGTEGKSQLKRDVYLDFGTEKGKEKNPPFF